MGQYQIFCHKEEIREEKILKKEIAIFRIQGCQKYRLMLKQMDFALRIKVAMRQGSCPD